MHSTCVCCLFTLCAEDRSLYPDIAVTDFPAHTERMHADGDFAFAHEFEVCLVN